MYRSLQCCWEERFTPGETQGSESRLPLASARQVQPPSHLHLKERTLLWRVSTQIEVPLLLTVRPGQRMERANCSRELTTCQANFQTLSRLHGRPEARAALIPTAELCRRRDSEVKGTVHTPAGGGEMGSWPSDRTAGAKSSKTRCVLLLLRIKGGKACPLPEGCPRSAPASNPGAVFWGTGRRGDFCGSSDLHFYVLQDPADVSLLTYSIILGYLRCAL